MASYTKIKGLNKGQNEKSDRERFITLDEFKRLLDTIEQAEWPEKLKQRDHCAVFLGFYLGLRVREAAMLERDNFRDIDQGAVYIRTVKATPRLSVTCSSCGRRVRVSAARIGQEHTCIRCGSGILIPTPKKKIDPNPPERKPPAVESKVLVYIKNYLTNVMRENQRWLFEGQHTENDLLENIPHISTCMLGRIFSHWAVKSGLKPLYSWHSLRHGRGVLIYERFEDQVMVRDMLRQSDLKSAEFYMHLSPNRQAMLQKTLDDEEGL